MPDLSKRPERYATVLVAALIAGSFAYNALGVRFGNDPRVAELKAQNEQLQQKAKSESEAASNAKAASGGAVTAVLSTMNCSAFGSQQAAQQYWLAHKADYPTWDGNRNGVACEQLKSANKPSTSSRSTSGSAAGSGGSFGTQPGASSAAAAVTSVRTVSQIVYLNKQATSHEPTPPPQVPAPPVVLKPTAPSKVVIVASRQHFGLYADTQDEYNNVSASLARDTTTHGYFEGFDTDFNADEVNAAWTAGEIPFLTWESRSLNASDGTVDFSLANIAAGGWDTYLRNYADAIKTNGLPLIIRFDQEMNGNWYRWAEPDPDFSNAKGSYIAAWRHVHDIFQAEGANDLVIWDWSPNRVDNIKRLPAVGNYYPGDAYVDWVGMTGYYRPGDGTATFAATYNATLAQLRQSAPGKPIFLSEVGATEIGGQKLNWVNSFFPGLVANPDVIGFVWFNYAVTAGGVTNDWRIQSTPVIPPAFRTGLYATAFGRDHGKKPILVTTVPSSSAPTSSPAAASVVSSTTPASPTSSKSATSTATSHATSHATSTATSHALTAASPSA
jgi:mannan endo-1,4-beta-mannosidase